MIELEKIWKKLICCVDSVWDRTQMPTWRPDLDIRRLHVVLHGFLPDEVKVRYKIHVQLRYSVHSEFVMKHATFTEVRNHAKQYFDIVESGESVRVLRNGKPIADIVPVMADLPSWKRRKAQPLVLDGVSVSRLILEERKSGL